METDLPLLGESLLLSPRTTCVIVIAAHDMYDLSAMSPAHAGGFKLVSDEQGQIPFELLGETTFLSKLACHMHTNTL